MGVIVGYILPNVSLLWPSFSFGLLGKVVGTLNMETGRIFIKRIHQERRTRVFSESQDSARATLNTLCLLLLRAGIGVVQALHDVLLNLCHDVNAVCQALNSKFNFRTNCAIHKKKHFKVTGSKDPVPELCIT